jgi:hypothetical protein
MTTMRTSNGLNVPVGWGGKAQPVAKRKAPAKPLRPQAETKGRYVVPSSGSGWHKPHQRRHLTAKAIVPGTHRVVGGKGNAYDVLARKVRDDGMIVLTVKSYASGNERTWIRRPDFHCEVL